MGRYYHGQIAGKFWVAIQCSLDASNFGVEPTQEYEFEGCGCYVDADITPDKYTYCQCYKSLKDHLSAIEDPHAPAQVAMLTWRPTGFVNYSFGPDTLEIVREKVQMLETRYGSRIKTYVLDKENNFQYEVETYELSKNSCEFVARLCLGRQILCCLETHGSCYFTSEL